MFSQWFCVCLALTAYVTLSHSQELNLPDEYLSREEQSPLCTEDSHKCTATSCWSRETGADKCGVPPAFQNAKECSETDCGITIEAYRAKFIGFHRTTLNITFPNTSSDIWFLFNATDSVECHHITANSSDEQGLFNLFYDCHRDIIGGNGIHKTVSVTVITNDKIFNGKFRVLDENELQSGSPFFYYHDNLIVPTVTFQSNDNLEYSVAVSKLKNGNYSRMYEKLVNISNKETYTERMNSLITVQLGKPLMEGSHQFTVMPKDCATESCKQFSTLDFTIIESSSSAAIIAAIVIIVILLLGFAIPLLIRWQQDLSLKPISGKMLLAFDPVSVGHTDMVQGSRVFLQELLAIDVLLDVTDIPKTEHKDPALWYQHAVDVSFVAVVVPPSVAADTVRGSPYQQTLPLCLDLMEKRWKNVLNNQSSVPRDGCVLILLDDSDQKLIPEICRSWPKFYLPKQALSLRQHLQSQEAKKGFRIRLPLSLLPKSDANDERFDKLVHEIKAQRCQLKEVICDAQQVQQSEAAGDSDGQKFGNAYGLDVGIADIKLIDDSSSSQDEEDLSGDESTNLQPESTPWKLY